MDSSLLVFKADYEIRSAEIDQTGKITIPGLLQLMQETSLKHAIHLKASIWDLKDSSWVLLSKKLKINRRPALGEKISIHTYPSGVKRIYAYRDYWVYDSKGKVLAWAASTWTLMHLKTRKIVPIPTPLTQLPFPDEYEVLSRPTPSIQIAATEYQQSTFKVGYHDIDWNNHVNNVQYLVFMLESSAELFQNYYPIELKIIFRGEALMGDLLNVHSCFEQNTSTSYHKIMNPDSKSISQAFIRWGLLNKD